MTEKAFRDICQWSFEGYINYRKSQGKYNFKVSDNKIDKNVKLPNSSARENSNKVFLVKNVNGYLRYKTITSQNMSSETQVKNFFISQKTYVPFSRYSTFCTFNPSMI